jgi:hypothetical protein
MAGAMMGRYRVDLGEAGRLEVVIEADVFALAPEDRQLVFAVVDLLKDRAELAPPPAERRRKRRSDAEKRQIVQRSYEVGTTEAARQAEAGISSVHAWRRRFPDLDPIQPRSFDPESARARAADAL